MRIKIIVGGHFNAGKTTLVRTASNIVSISTERKVSNPVEKRLKQTTTTAMDYGKLNLDGYDINIYGIPGQERFSFMWETLSKGANGFIFLFDSTNEELWGDTIKQINVMVKNDEPYILCANKQDLPGAKPLSYIRHKLELTKDIPITPCIAKDRGIVAEILSALIYIIRPKGGSANELAKK